MFSFAERPEGSLQEIQDICRESVCLGLAEMSKNAFVFRETLPNLADINYPPLEMPVRGRCLLLVEVGELVLDLLDVILNLGERRAAESTGQPGLAPKITLVRQRKIRSMH